MKISEIFLSFQGEGVYSGIPAVFVRVGGCNLSCKWCDTEMFNFDDDYHFGVLFGFCGVGVGVAGVCAAVVLEASSV